MCILHQCHISQAQIILSLSFCVFLLKLRNLTVLFHLEDLKKLKYLECVNKEAMQQHSSHFFLCGCIHEDCEVVRIV